jgi:FKBP-type peptidyl-prolyl cis-trans isomerase FklB
MKQLPKAPLQALALTLALACSQAWSADATALNGEKDKLSYAIGSSIGTNLRKEGAAIDLAVLIQAMKTSIAGEATLLPEPEIRQILADYQTKMRQQNQVNRQKATLDNKKTGDAFLADFKAKPGVQATPNGLLFKILTLGSGNKPTEADQVEVAYRGALTNGRVFDATPAGRPATLKVGSLIAGWKQALAMMPAGSKWQVVVPPELAYGERGVGNDIGPNEVLVFDVELIAIK